MERTAAINAPTAGNVGALETMGSIGRREFMMTGTAALAGTASAFGAASPNEDSPHGKDRNRRLAPFRGMMPIMATPVDAEHKVDLESQRREVEYCIQCGAVAVGHFAYASEFQKISEGDRLRLLDVVVNEVDGRVPFFAGVTGKTAADTVRYAKEAEARGADIVMVSLPYVDELDAVGTLAMFNAIAAAVKVPIIIQDTSHTAAVLTADVVAQIAKETGQVIAIKAESPDFLTKTAELMKRFDGTMQVIGGAGGQHMIHLLRLGVTAFMTGTEALEFHAACVAAYLDGDENKAASIYYNKILPYLTFYSAGNWLRNLKMMLYTRGIIDTPNLCPPDDDVPPAYGDVEMEQFRWTLDYIGWTKQWPNIP